MAVIYRLNYAINTSNKVRKGGREAGREAVSHPSYRSGDGKGNDFIGR